MTIEALRGWTWWQRAENTISGNESNRQLQAGFRPPQQPWSLMTVARRTWRRRILGETGPVVRYGVHMQRRCILIAALTAALLKADDIPVYRNPSKTIEERTEDLLSRMTQAEKVGQLSQGVLRPGVADPNAYIQPIRSGAIGSYILSLGSDDPAARNTLQEIATKQSRLGIPLIFGFDTIHGLRTVFPIPLAISCTWDPALFEFLSSRCEIFFSLLFMQAFVKAPFR